MAKSAPDGYTIFLTTNTANSSNPHLFKKLPYDAIRDFTPIARICYFPFVLAVNASLPVNTPRELIDYAKNSKQPISYGYGNSTGQVASAAFSTLTQINATAVPYKSSPQVLTDLIGGQITFLFGDLASSAAHIKSGRIRAIAVTTERGSALAPDLPALATAATRTGFYLAARVDIAGAAQMPADVTPMLSVEINRSRAPKDITDKLLGMGAGRPLLSLATTCANSWLSEAKKLGMRGLFRRSAAAPVHQAAATLLSEMRASDPTQAGTKQKAGRSRDRPAFLSPICVNIRHARVWPI